MSAFTHRIPAPRRILSAFAFAAIALTGIAHAQSSNNGLFTINNPGGGQVVYGPMTHITTLPEAMGAMLHNVHGHFGDKPQIVGKIVQSKDGTSIAAFFTVVSKNGNGKKMGGLAIVAAPKNAPAAAAVLYDEADRFGKTEPVLLSKLNDAWQRQNPPKAHAANTSMSQSQHSSQPAAQPSAPHQNYPVQPLHTAANGDQSGTVSIPADWRVTGGSGGTLYASGPKGEGITAGEHIQNIYDPSNPRSSGMVQYLSRGSTPFFTCSPGNLIAAYQCLFQQSSRRQHKPEPTLSDIQSTRMQTNGSFAQAVQLTFTIDRHDGKGPKRAYAELGQTRELPGGGWTVYISEVEVPVALAEQEWPTLRATWASFRANGKVINGEIKVEIAQRKAINDANQALADARSQANDAHNKSIDDNRAKQNQHGSYSSGDNGSAQDEQDWQSKIFQNYTLDRTVVRTADDEYHIHTDYPTADALVRGNPNNFEYVPNQQLMKGVDW